MAQATAERLHLASDIVRGAAASRAVLDPSATVRRGRGHHRPSCSRLRKYTRGCESARARLPSSGSPARAKGVVSTIRVRTRARPSTRGPPASGAGPCPHDALPTPQASTDARPANTRSTPSVVGVESATARAWLTSARPHADPKPTHLCRPPRWGRMPTRLFISRVRNLTRKRPAKALRRPRG